MKNTTKKTIKRYQNRKLYDTQQSCYVTLEDIAKMLRQGDDIVVIDNRTKEDITPATLTQIIFETEKRLGFYSPIPTLIEIIKNKNGSMSDYLAHLGVFAEDYYKNQKGSKKTTFSGNRSANNTMEPKQSIEERVANAVDKNENTKTILPSSKTEPSPRVAE